MSFKDKLPKQYKGIMNNFSLYWSVYGGFTNLFRSPYLHLAILLSFISYPLWTCERTDTWFDITLSAIPNVLGFTLGGYAILLAFGEDKFRKIISGKTKEGKTSPFMVVNGAFIHFIILQIIAILVAIIGKAWGIKVGIFAWFGFLCFLYSILTAIAAALAVLQVAEWFDQWQSRQD